MKHFQGNSFTKNLQNTCWNSKLMKKLCFVLIKFCLVFYTCVFMIWFLNRDYNKRSNDRRVPDVIGGDGVNGKGYHSLQPSELNTLKKGINTSESSVRTSPVANFQWMPVRLSILVCSHPAHVQRRLTIRRTWGYNLSKDVLVLFLVGMDKSGIWKSVLERESTMYGDIIKVNILEDYRNLTRKMIAGLKTISAHFSGTRYVLKTDDDTYINVPYLLQEISQNVIGESNIVGALCINATVIRDPRDVWFVSPESYPYSTYPSYVAGGAYLLPIDTLKKILSRVDSQYSYIHLEDVFITGILAQSAGLQHVSHAGFSFWNSKKVTACDIINNRKISGVNMSDKQIKTLHGQIQRLYIVGC